MKCTEQRPDQSCGLVEECSVPASLTFLPQVKGMYRCLIICLICRFIVTKSSTKKYSRRMGQKTGTSKMGKNVAKKPNMNALVDDHLQQKFRRHCSLLRTPQNQVHWWQQLLSHQNLNSGRRLMNGLYSSVVREGRAGPSSSGST